MTAKKAPGRKPAAAEPAPKPAKTAGEVAKLPIGLPAKADLGIGDRASAKRRDQVVAPAPRRRGKGKRS